MEFEIKGLPPKLRKPIIRNSINFETMKQQYKYIILLFFSVFLAQSCDKEDFPYEEYRPNIIATNDGAVTYANFETYPLLDNISIDTPTIDIDTEYKFVIDSIHAPAGSTFSEAKFSIDEKSGVVVYDNSGDDLSAGDYGFDVGVQVLDGMVLYTNALIIKVNEVPLSLTIDNSVVDVGSLQLGVIATVSAVDNSGGQISSVDYELVDAPAEYSIDPTSGEISKTAPTTQGISFLGVRATTNLGTVTQANILTINTGASPTVAYFQQDGTTPLTQVTISPWTAYTTSTPTLNDMTAASWSVILPATLTNYSSSFSADSDGKISIAADANLPEGDYLIGVTATNSGGVSNDFADVFTIKVEFRWTQLFDDQLNDPAANVTPQVAYPGVWAGYLLSGTPTSGEWKKVANVGAGSFTGMRRWNPGTVDGVLLRTIDITNVKGMRVSFGEVIGYGTAFTDLYNREFYYGDSDANVQNQVWDANEWNTLLGATGAWLGTNWNGGSGPTQSYDNILVDLTQVTGNTLYLNWRLYSTDVTNSGQNGQWIIDYVTVDEADVFAAEEQ